jgi:hypothetical protein
VVLVGLGKHRSTGEEDEVAAAALRLQRTKGTTESTIRGVSGKFLAPRRKRERRRVDSWAQLVAEGLLRVALLGLLLPVHGVAVEEMTEEGGGNGGGARGIEQGELGFGGASAASL